ncbi:MAG: hypothetical protein ABIH20_03760 [Candidatus Diapherotrites archaeon]
MSSPISKRLGLKELLRQLDLNFHKKYGYKQFPELEKALIAKRDVLQSRLNRDEDKINEKWNKIESLGTKGSPREYLENYYQMSLLENVNALLREQLELRHEIKWLASSINRRFGDRLSDAEASKLVKLQAVNMSRVADLGVMIDRNKGSIFDALGRAAINLRAATKLIGKQKAAAARARLEKEKKKKRK